MEINFLCKLNICVYMCKYKTFDYIFCLKVVSNTCAIINKTKTGKLNFSYFRLPSPFTQSIHFILSSVARSVLVFLQIVACCAKRPHTVKIRLILVAILFQSTSGLCLPIAISCSYSSRQLGASSSHSADARCCCCCGSNIAVLRVPECSRCSCSCSCALYRTVRKWI